MYSYISAYLFEKTFTLFILIYMKIFVRVWYVRSMTQIIYDPAVGAWIFEDGNPGKHFSSRGERDELQDGYYCLKLEPRYIVTCSQI